MEVGFRLSKAAASCGLLAASADFYVCAHDLCRDTLQYQLPLGDTSRYFGRLEVDAVCNVRARKAQSAFQAGHDISRT